MNKVGGWIMKIEEGSGVVNDKSSDEETPTSGEKIMIRRSGEMK